MNDERIKMALRALADQDRGLEAPARVEVRLRSAVRSRRILRSWRRSAVAGLIAAAMAIAMVAIQSHRAKAPGIVTVDSTAHPAVSGSVESGAVQTQAKADASGMISKGAIKRARPFTQRSLGEGRARNTHAIAPQTLTDFIPLMNPEPPFERGEILRVNLPASAMQMVGLPVQEDRAMERVNADVLVGEEGLPRAIRFVSFEGR